MDAQTEQAFKNSGSWFFWIAGCTLVNVSMTLTNGNFGLALGVSLVDVFPALLKAFSAPNEVFLISSLCLAAVFIGLFGLLGKFASEGKSWAFIVGMLVFGVDTAICGLLQDWMGLGVHLFALYSLFIGLKLALSTGKRQPEPATIPVE